MGKDIHVHVRRDVSANSFPPLQLSIHVVHYLHTHQGAILMFHILETFISNLFLYTITFAKFNFGSCVGSEIFFYSENFVNYGTCIIVA